MPLVMDSKRRIKALKSKKKMAKLIGATGGKIVFDDETGEARPAHPFADEASILDKSGARVAFVEEEKARLAERDVRDRQVQKEKRRVKKEKKREKEKGGGAADSAAEEEEDGDNGLERIAAPFAELADLYDGEEGEEAQVRKRPKKWFEDDSDADQDTAAGAKRKKKTKRQDRELAEPETLEDLEVLVSGLLAG